MVIEKRGFMDSKKLANKIRIHALKMTSLGKSSHIASVFSMADILAVLYGGFLNIDPENPHKPDRDRFILSKGHTGVAVYAVLAETGFFSVDKLRTHYQDGSDLSGHVSHKGIPGVELSTGSLGHGLSVGAGMALEAKLSGKAHRVVVLLSDGECDEGSNWEAILFSGHHKLFNLIAIIDYNKYQALTSVSETLDLEPFADKWKCFGWNVYEVDGHNHDEIKKVLNGIHGEKEEPTVLIAHTVKGKGVSFMEADPVLWHYRAPQGDEFEAALKELEYPL
jgi:transketolase